MVNRAALLLAACAGAAACAATCSKRKPAPPPPLVLTWEGDAFKIEGTDVTGKLWFENDSMHVKVEAMYHPTPTATVPDLSGQPVSAEYYSARTHFGDVPLYGDTAAPLTVDLALPLTITLSDGRSVTAVLGKYEIRPIGGADFFPPGKPFQFRQEVGDGGSGSDHPGPKTLALDDDRKDMYGGVFGPGTRLRDIDLVARVTSGDKVESKQCGYGSGFSATTVEVRFLAAKVEIFDRRTGALVDQGVVPPDPAHRDCPYSVSRSDIDYSPEVVLADSSVVKVWVESWLARQPR